MLRSVLIVDDAKSSQEVLKYHLERLGVQEITTANNGLEAIELVKLYPNLYKGIFTDLNMPTMDGMQFIRELSHVKYTGSVAIISVLDTKIIELAVSLARAEHVHLVGFLTKPFEQDTLIHIIERMTNVSRFQKFKTNLLKQRQLRSAIEQKDFVPYFQPKVNGSTKQVVGFELLCRIALPEESQLITPDRFIPVAEKFNLIESLFENFMATAEAPIKKLLAAFPKNYPLQISFNISACQLDNTEFPNLLTSICHQLSIKESQISVEINEREDIFNHEKLIIIERLRINGVGVSLDNFGTGFTNIAQLNQYPFTEIKLDASIAKNIHRDDMAQIITRSLIAVTTNLGMKFCAEGIDNNKDFSFLVQHTTADIQGYLVSRPKPIDEMLRWLAAWNHNWHINLQANDY